MATTTTTTTTTNHLVFRIVVFWSMVFVSIGWRASLVPPTAIIQLQSCVYIEVVLVRKVVVGLRSRTGPLLCVNADPVPNWTDSSRRMSLHTVAWNNEIEPLLHLVSSWNRGENEWGLLWALYLAQRWKSWICWRRTIVKTCAENVSMNKTKTSGSTAIRYYPCFFDWWLLVARLRQ